MGTAAKPPPFVCFKWPWGPSLNASPSPSPCGDLDLPWLFKSIRTVAQGLLIAGDLPSPSPSPSTRSGGHGARLWRRHPGPAAVDADRGDEEQRALAVALLSGKAATVLQFYSPRCRLCSSLQGLVRELEDGAEGCASFVLADAEDDRWLPELLHYDVRYVPCFVLLDKNGRAVAKTGVPSSRQHVIAGLHHLLNMKQPSGVKEVMLLGQNKNSYNDTSELEELEPGKNWQLSEGFSSSCKVKDMGSRFADLLDQLSLEYPEMRFRFTSPHPKDFPDELLYLMRDRHNICKQIHLPAQSGSTEVLERMKRGYTREAYSELVQKICDVIPHVGLSSDFVSGFCGETEDDHAEIMRMMFRMMLSRGDLQS